jgi:DNA mismatch repair protein MutS2
MPFNTGDHVLVANFGRAIVRDVRNGGRYLVELKGRAMIATEAQLTRLEERRRQRGSAKVQAPTIGAADALPRTNAASSVDLHGMTAEEAVVAVDAFLNDAFLGSLDEVRIIHGRSGGRLRAAVHGRLRGMTAIRAFRLDPANPGVTIVSL